MRIWIDVAIWFTLCISVWTMGAREGFVYLAALIFLALAGIENGGLLNMTDDKKIPPGKKFFCVSLDDFFESHTKEIEEKISAAIEKSNEECRERLHARALGKRDR